MLAAILRQNPRFHASVTSPLENLFVAFLRVLSAQNESAFSVSDDKRKRILSSIVDAYYSDCPEEIIFDTSRAWCNDLPILAMLFSTARVICCVRQPAWILDSIERLIQHNALQPSKIFNCEPVLTLYPRAEIVMNPVQGLCGQAMSGLRQAWFSEHANRLIVIRYETLTLQPAKIIGQLYDILGEEQFKHNFDQLEYGEPEYDARLGTPGLHKVMKRVSVNKRQTILPPELFRLYSSCYWDDPEQNPRGVIVM